MLAPECAVKFSFLQKWLALEALPIVFGVILGLLVIVLASWRGILAIKTWCSRRQARQVATTRNRGQRSPPPPNTIWDTIMGLYLSALYYLYFVVVNNAMAVFACSSPGSGGGPPTMDSEPSVKCVDSNATYVLLRRLAFFALVLYGT